MEMKSHRSSAAEVCPFVAPFEDAVAAGVSEPNVDIDIDAALSTCLGRCGSVAGAAIAGWLCVTGIAGSLPAQRFGAIMLEPAQMQRHCLRP